MTVSTGKLYGALFGAWAVLAAFYALRFTAALACGSLDPDQLMVAVCGVNVCLLLWGRWRAPQVISVTRFDFTNARVDLVNGTGKAVMTRKEEGE